MNIKQVEEITGITKQNIRFYEKQALIFPKRNPENDYRDYLDEDIRHLKIIKILRKPGMPIEEIRDVLTESVSLKDALEKRKQDLEIEKTAMEASIRFCAQLRPQSIQTLDTDSVLKNMEEEEKRGSVFLDFMNDFKLVANAEIKKYFSFMPDSMIKTPAEFSYELVKYAKENDLEIAITKESMHPEFTLDGVAFRAVRNFGVLGAAVECKIAHPELVEPRDIKKKKKHVKNVIVGAAGCGDFCYHGTVICCTDRISGYGRGSSFFHRDCGFHCFIRLFVQAGIKNGFGIPLSVFKQITDRNSQNGLLLAETMTNGHFFNPYRLERAIWAIKKMVRKAAVEGVCSGR